MRHFFKKFSKDRTASTAVELALVMPMFMLLVFIIIEYSYVMYLRSSVETIVHNMARQAMTNNYSTTTVYNQLRQSVSDIVVTANDIDISARLYKNVADLNRENGGINIIGEDIAGGMVRYAVNVDYNLITPVVNMMPGIDNTLRITTASFVKHEYDD